MNMFKCWAALLIAIMLLPNAASADAAKDAYDKGKACLDKRDYDAAITAFTEAIRLEPKNTQRILPWLSRPAEMRMGQGDC